jgi:hypothetical protein
MPYELDLELFDSIKIEVGWTIDWFCLLGSLLYYIMIIMIVFVFLYAGD